MKVVSKSSLVGLKKIADDAIATYSAETAAGGEPEYPQWAKDLLNLIDAHHSLREFAADLTVTIKGLEKRNIRLFAVTEELAHLVEQAVMKDGTPYAHLQTRDGKLVHAVDGLEMAKIVIAEEEKFAQSAQEIAR